LEKKHHFLGVNYASFMPKFTTKNVFYSFYVIFSIDNSFIGLKNGFGLIMPTPKFWQVL
jgi:hypothetical protein